MKIFEVDQKFLDYQNTKFYKTFGDSIFHNSHNTRDTEKDGFVKFKFRELPKDTSSAFHLEVNSLTKQQLGIPVRSLLFALPSKLGAKNISGSGTVYSVYPVSENFRIFYAENVVDMTVDLDVTVDDLSQQARIYTEYLVYDTFNNIPDILPNERQKYLNDIGYLVDVIISNNDKVPNITGLTDYFNLCFSEMKKYMIKKNMDEKLIDAVDVAFKKTRTLFQNKAYNYVNSLVEVTDPSQLSDISKFAELMVYDPKGFIFKKI